MNETMHWALPLLSAGQAQKEITHNEAVLAIDRLLHPAVISRSVSTPPVEPLPGDAYIVGARPVALWSGHADKLTTFDGQSWAFTAPRTGCLVWIGDEAIFSFYSGNRWSDGAWPAQGLQIGGRAVLTAAPSSAPAPSGGDTVDSECRAALNALIAALRNQGVIVSSD